MRYLLFYELIQEDTLCGASEEQHVKKCSGNTGKQVRLGPSTRYSWAPSAGILLISDTSNDIKFPGQS